MNRSNKYGRGTPGNTLTDLEFITLRAGLSYRDDEAFLGTLMQLTTMQALAEIWIKAF